MDRSTFLKGAVAGLGMVAGLGSTSQFSFAQEATQERRRRSATLRLCSQEGKITGANFKEKIEKLQKWGGRAIELHGNPKDRIKEVQEVLADTRIRVSALCWGSCDGKLVSTDAKVRQEGIDALKSTLDTAGQLKANGVIFVPCFNGQSELKPEELDKIMLDILPGLGEFAAQCKTRILIEPLNQGETFYINRLEQAARFCKEVNSPGLALMGDFYHMGKEEKSDKDAFEGAADYLRHVHIASRKSRNMPGDDGDSYVEGFRGLKKINYRQFVSLECGLKKGLNPDEEMQKCFDLLRKQWEEATV